MNCGNSFLKNSNSGNWIDDTRKVLNWVGAYKWLYMDVVEFIDNAKNENILLWTLEKWAFEHQVSE